MPQPNPPENRPSAASSPLEEPPAVDDRPPRTGRLLSWVGRSFLNLAGWSTDGPPPTVTKAVVIAAPHTSWHDAVFMLAVAWSMRASLSWLVKSTVFVKPFRRTLRWLGAIPVDRGGGSDTVEQIARRFEASGGLYLALSPPGTREKTDHWKSGFYNIALAAGVPVMLGFLDYKRRRGGVGKMLRLTGDKRADMDVIRAFYGPIRGRFPEQESAIRLKDEDSTV